MSEISNTPIYEGYISEIEIPSGRYKIQTTLGNTDTGEYHVVLGDPSSSENLINISPHNLNYSIDDQALWNLGLLALQSRTAQTTTENQITFSTPSSIKISSTAISISSPSIELNSSIASITSSNINLNSSTTISIIANAISLSATSIQTRGGLINCNNVTTFNSMVSFKSDPNIFVDEDKGNNMGTTTGVTGHLNFLEKSATQRTSAQKWGDVYCGKVTSASDATLVLRVYQNHSTSNNNAYFRIQIDNSATPVRRTYSNCKIYGAVWNDYAEYRAGSVTAGGYCVTETPTGAMIKSTQRLQPGCKVTSDTFGFAIGENKNAKSPIAVSGRVLVYPYRSREEYPLGAALCSAPNGTVDIMTREEIREYPERIIGTVSEIPEYEVWHGGDGEGDQDVEVDGRIWIYVK